MKEDFVTYEQARKLAELGFDYETFIYYQVSNGELIDNGLRKDFNWKTRNNPKRCTSISCPTLSQATKWIRTKGLSVQVQLNVAGAHFFSRVWEIKLYGSITEPSKLYSTYEDAQSAGIDKALEILTDKL